MGWIITEITRLPNCKPVVREWHKWQHENAIEAAFFLAEEHWQGYDVQPMNDPCDYVLLAGLRDGVKIKTVAVSPDSENGKGVRLLPSWAQPEKTMKGIK